VKNQTPKVAKADDKKKGASGRKKKRITYNRRFLTQAVAPGMKYKANPQNIGQM
jgi:ribosomal protein S30